MMRDIEHRLETLSDARLPAPPSMDELRERAATRRRRRHVSSVAGAAVLLLVAVFTVGALSGVLAPDEPPLIDEPDPAGEVGETWDRLPEAPLRQRHRHAAVWTGHEMLVWGGVVDSGGAEPFADDGAAFNPATGEWRELSDSPLSDRYDPHAIWTGEEVIVWGGRSHVVEETVQGAAYRPDDDSWRTIANSGLPERVGFSALLDVAGSHVVWTGEEMIVVGVGPEPGGGDGLRRDAAAYRPDRDEWRSLPALPEDLDGIGATVWADGQLIVSATAGSEPRTLTYQPGNHVWEVATPAPAIVEGNRRTVVWTGDEMLVWGIDPSDGERGLAYDPSDDTWRSLPTAPIEAREFHAWTWTGQEMVVWGGATRRGGSEFDQHADGAAYHPGANTWRRLPDAPLPARSYPTAVWTSSRVLIWGGGWDDIEPTGAAYQPGDVAITGQPTVPNVIGMRLADAVEILEAKGLNGEPVSGPGWSDPDDPAAVVVSQTPHAGAEVPASSAVGFRTALISPQLCDVLRQVPEAGGDADRLARADGYWEMLRDGQPHAHPPLDGYIALLLEHESEGTRLLVGAEDLPPSGYVERLLEHTGAEELPRAVDSVTIHHRACHGS